MRFSALRTTMTNPIPLPPLPPTVVSVVTAAFITMLLQGSAVGVWIGQRIDDTDCWTNGRPVGYTNWSPRNSPAVSTLYISYE